MSLSSCEESVLRLHIQSPDFVAPGSFRGRELPFPPSHNSIAPRHRLRRHRRAPNDIFSGTHVHHRALYDHKVCRSSSPPRRPYRRISWSPTPSHRSILEWVPYECRADTVRHDILTRKDGDIFWDVPEIFHRSVHKNEAAVQAQIAVLSPFHTSMYMSWAECLSASCSPDISTSSAVVGHQRLHAPHERSPHSPTIS